MGQSTSTRFGGGRPTFNHRGENWSADPEFWRSKNEEDCGPAQKLFHFQLMIISEKRESKCAHDAMFYLGRAFNVLIFFLGRRFVCIVYANLVLRPPRVFLLINLLTFTLSARVLFVGSRPDGFRLCE